ncbi:MAG TPA: VWA domain-containing protein [Pyrinomonadaceae bacterium]|nr:VWA domain-containing protein [Pyrinomonadaceae bacterium]
MSDRPSPSSQSAPHRRRRRLLAALLAALIPLTPAGARQQDGDEVVRVNSELVVLNVTVTDREGRYVHKLARSDFRVFEDGSEQPLSLFSVEETPFAAAILIDTSGSMEGRVSMARAAAIRFLDGLRADDVAAVYHFDSRVEQVQDFSPGRDLPPIAYQLSARGLTAMNDAVFRAAADLSRRPERRRAVVLLSDGADNHSGVTADKALEAALAADAVVYTVDMMDLSSNATQRMKSAGALKQLAAKSGGRYVPTPGGRELGEAFAGIVDELSNQYTLGYRPTNKLRDGRWRAIDLKLSREDLKARTRSGYRAPKA